MRRPTNTQVSASEASLLRARVYGTVCQLTN